MRSNPSSFFRWVVVAYLIAYTGPVAASVYGQEPVKAPTAVGYSYSRPDEVAIKHLALEIIVDFKKRQLSGKAQYEIDNKKRVNFLVLDTRDLTIQSATTGRDNNATDFFLGQEHPDLGRPLSIAITSETQFVTITYITGRDAAGLQWLEPIQTTGKKRPFLYANSQPIYARSWIPCQDNPVARMTFRAKVKTPPGMLALMSAINPRAKNSRGVYEFDMPQPIPAELITLAVGDIDFQVIGNRTGIYAEPEMVGKAASELRDVDRMIAVAESLFGPYRWGRYDVLFLPPAYLWGGMENPRLTFATPTILAGDRSLVSVIAHELAHSWSGNLVTNATWNDVWLSESFTTYLERRIVEGVYGKEFAEMEAVLGWRELNREMVRLGPTNPATRLYVESQTSSPGDVDPTIVYEKGYFFLRAIEEAAGRRRWDAFLRTYFDRFAFQSVTTAQFISYYGDLLATRDSVLKARVDIDAWVYKPGIPADAPAPRSSRLSALDEEMRRWQNGKTTVPLRTLGWSTQEWIYFLRQLPDTLSAAGMSRLDQAFDLTGRKNAEIALVWLGMAIRHNYRTAFLTLEEFLKSVGRLKYLAPLYQALAESQEGLQLGKMIFAEAKYGYHPIAVKRIQQILNR